MSTVVRHGYYAAKSQHAVGDLGLALKAAELWKTVGVPAEHIGNVHGVSVYEHHDGRRTARLVTRDINTGLTVIRELDAETGAVLDPPATLKGTR